MFRWFSAFYLVLFVCPLTAADLLGKVRTEINRSLPFAADFRQKLVYEGQVELEESGRLVVKNPDLIKWHYVEPEVKTFLLKGSRYYFYDRDFGQLTVGRIENRKGEWIWQLLFSEDIREICIEDTQRRILTIRDTARGVDITVQLSEQMIPVRVVQQEEGGYQRVLEFSAFTARVSLLPGEFELNIPPETDIIKLD
jgi:outer membrane lipoprotein-sorting protein